MYIRKFCNDLSAPQKKKKVVKGLLIGLQVHFIKCFKVYNMSQEKSQTCNDTKTKRQDCHEEQVNTDPQGTYVDPEVCIYIFFYTVISND